MSFITGKIIKQKSIKDKTIIAIQSQKYLINLIILDNNKNILKGKSYVTSNIPSTMRKINKIITKDFNLFKKLVYSGKEITIDDYDILTLDKK